MRKASYEVHFFRHLASRSGRPVRSRLTTLNIRRCQSRREAAVIAIKEFERQWALYEWKNLADEIEVSEVSPADTAKADKGTPRAPVVSSADAMAAL